MTNNIREKRLFNLIILWSSLFIVFLVIHIVIKDNPQFYFNFTDSEPLGLYKLIPFTGNLKKNDLVLFNAPEQVQKYLYGRGWLPNGWLLIKNVGALNSDKVTITNNAIYVSNSYIGPVFGQDHEGKPLPKLRGNIIIPRGYFLPIATRIATSFDGRYIGPVSMNLIKGKAILIFKF